MEERRKPAPGVTGRSHPKERECRAGLKRSGDMQDRRGEGSESRRASVHVGLYSSSMDVISKGKVERLEASRLYVGFHSISGAPVLRLV